MGGPRKGLPAVTPHFPGVYSRRAEPPLIAERLRRQGCLQSTLDDARSAVSFFDFLLLHLTFSRNSRPHATSPDPIGRRGRGRLSGAGGSLRFSSCVVHLERVTEEECHRDGAGFLDLGRDLVIRLAAAPGQTLENYAFAYAGLDRTRARRPGRSAIRTLLRQDQGAFLYVGSSRYGSRRSAKCSGR